MGEWWKDRLDCRQWGAHFPHVAGIAGQSGVGSQSVVLSGGYEDDKDEGEWFLYTGSGGRDLSGNKRTNKVGLGGRGAGTLMVMLSAAVLSRGHVTSLPNLVYLPLFAEGDGGTRGTVSDIQCAVSQASICLL